MPKQFVEMDDTVLYEIVKFARGEDVAGVLLELAPDPFNEKLALDEANGYLREQGLPITLTACRDNASGNYDYFAWDGEMDDVMIDAYQACTGQAWLNKYEPTKWAN